jgi:C-terminal processing protease CtpA/Prc
MLTLSSKLKSRAFAGVWWLALGLFVVALGLPADAQGQVTFTDNFQKVMDRTADLIPTLQNERLAKDLPGALEKLPAMLRKAGIEVGAVTPGSQIRLGAKMVPVEGQLWWKHFEGTKQCPWVDVIAFGDEESAKRVFDLRRQGHSGYYSPDHMSFITLGAPKGLDAVAVIVLRGRYLFNFGMGVPFGIKPGINEGNSPDELKYINDSIDSLPVAMEAVARSLIDPSYITWIPPANPNDEDRKIQRMAAFARLWSEVKYNFVFLDRRPDLDWESVLELYLPRVAAARTDEEYTRVLQEAIALLKDGHTQVHTSLAKDMPALRIEPIEGKPVVVEVGDTPEMRASGVAPGMELTAVNGGPVEQMLRDKIYPYVAASSSQDRDNRAYGRLLEGDRGSKVSATFRDLQGRTRTVELVCDLYDHPPVKKWWQRPPLESRQLADGIMYVALNTFATDEVAKEFDWRFIEILNSKGLILDVRENGGGSDPNGYAIIARLIDKTIAQPYKWRARVYKPTARAHGQPEEWEEGYEDPIRPSGDRAYLGPVVVLIGPRTFSAAEDFLVPLKATKRATLIGTPTGGSTGQPVSVRVYKANLAICTVWCRFPDDTEFVGVGIQPDIPVQQTKHDVAEGRDPVLERAVAFLSGAKQESRLH